MSTDLKSLGLEFGFNENNEPVLRKQSPKLPFNPRAALRHASELCLQGNHLEGIRIFQELLEMGQFTKLASINLANAYLDMMQLDKALSLTEKSYQLDPNDVFTHQTFFKIYLRMGNLRAAEKHLILAQGIEPDAETNDTLEMELLAYKNNLNEYLKRLGRSKEAVLYIGNMPFSFEYSSMFPESDFLDIFGVSNRIVEEPVFMYPYDRLQRIGFEYLPYKKRAWKGEDLTGKTLMVFSEQGLGDNIWLLNLVRKVKKKYGCRIKLVTYKQLHCIVNKLDYIDEVLFPCFDISELVGSDYVVNIFGLLEFIAPEFEEAYMPVFTHKKFPESNKKKILVNWICKKNLSHVKQLNMNLLSTIIDNNKDKCNFYVVQRNSEETKVQEDIKRYGLDITSIPCENVDELFSYISDSDLVLTVDTLHIHAAGALDKRAICMLARNITLPFWGRDSESVPYYRSVRAVRDMNVLVNEKLF